ncbi:hypothetical protein AAFC00_002635 [Neodothiora populina]|uniref:AB hydrolase-1 domain-containing protein n=1 Tax=Neodothiora populina TaxID=2781224 RepID=A0ABR3P7Q2_9PEZI
MSGPRTVLHSARQLSNGLVRRTNIRKRFVPLPTATTTRSFTSRGSLQSQATSAQEAIVDAERPAQPHSVNQPLSFPCLDAIDTKTQRLQKKSLSGPEPSYAAGETERYHCPDPILLDWGGVLPEFDVAYETWGTLNADKSNAILLHTGLSASSHAKSTEKNPKPGWWEKFIGPGAPLDTNRYFIVCTNVIGGCYGSTGPSSFDPQSERYATRFPILTMQDMVRAQFRLLDWMGINKLYASVGSSMGGMQSLAAAVLERERVGKVVSVSGCARSHPYSIAMRHTQRQVLMNDPAWSSTRGNYYNSIPPHAGMKLSREIATVTYRSGPEWEQRFGRRRADPSKPPALCPDFLIETYLDHAGEKWCLEYDANSLLYVSKAMDLFDLGEEHMTMLDKVRADNAWKLDGFNVAKAAARGEDEKASLCNLTLPDTPYEEQETTSADLMASSPEQARETQNAIVVAEEPPEDLVKGLGALRDTPTLVMGVASDILFPAWQQREIAAALRKVGNRRVTHVELGEDRSLFGHDTFLLDLEGVGGEIRRFLG